MAPEIIDLSIDLWVLGFWIFGLRREASFGVSCSCRSEAIDCFYGLSCFLVFSERFLSLWVLGDMGSEGFGF